MTESKPKYTLSRKAQIQRQTVNFKHGYRSEILKKLSNCHNCFYRAYCTIKTTEKIDEDHGCKDIRQAFIANLTELTLPESKLASIIASLQTEADLRGLMDGKDQEGLGKDRLKIYSLIKDFMKLLLEYKDVKSKYTVGEKKQIEHVHRFEGDEVFDVDDNGEKEN